jgi:hypothetical protein
MSAATEATLEELLYVARSQNTNLNAIQRLLSGSGGGGGGNAGVSNASRDAERNIRSMSAASAAASAALGALKLATNLVGGIIGTVVNVFTTLIGSIQKTILNLVQFGQMAMLGTARLSDFYSALGDLPFFMGTIFRMYADIIRVREATLDAFRQISTSGATFGGSLTEFRNTAFRARLTMQEFSEAVRGSAEALAPIGTQEGARRFGAIVAQLTSGAMGNALFGLGYTAKQIADGTGTFLSVIGGMNRARSLSDAQLAQGAAGLLLEIDLLAKATGKSREEAEKALKDKQFQGAFEYFTNNLGNEQKTAVRAMISRVQETSPALADFIKQFLMTGGGPLVAMNDQMSALFASLGPGLEGLVADFARAGTQTKDRAASEALLENTLTRAARMFEGNVVTPLGRSASYLALFNNGLLNQNGLLSRLVRNQGMTEEEQRKNSARNVAEQKKAAAGSAAAAAQAEYNIRNFGQAIFAMVEKFITPIAQQLESVLKQIVQFILPYVKSIFNWLFDAFNKIKTAGSASIEGGLRVFSDKLVEGADKIWAAMAPIWEAMKPVLIKIFDGFANFLKPYFVKMADYVIDSINAWMSTVPILRSLPGVEDPEKRKAQRNVQYTEMEVESLRREVSDFQAANARNKNAALESLITKKQQRINELMLWIEENRSREKNQTPVPPARQLGTVGMTGSWWEKEDKTVSIHAGETVATQDQIKQIVDYASQNGSSNELSRLNTLMSQLVRETQRVADNTARNVQATKELNGNMFAA